MMHICHRSLYPDAYCSVMLDVTDDQTYFAGTSRDQRLLVLWKSYRNQNDQSRNKKEVKRGHVLTRLNIL